jgi:hypothetical protein
VAGAACLLIFHVIGEKLCMVPSLNLHFTGPLTAAIGPAISTLQFPEVTSPEAPITAGPLANPYTGI